MKVLTSMAAALSAVLLGGMPVGVTAMTGGGDRGSGTPDSGGASTADGRAADDPDGQRGDRGKGDDRERAEDRDERAEDHEADGRAGKESGPPSWAGSAGRAGRKHGRLVRAWAACLGRHHGDRSVCGAHPTPPGLAKGLPPGLAKREKRGAQRPHLGWRHGEERAGD